MEVLVGKSPINIYKWWIFHHVSLPEGNLIATQRSMMSCDDYDHSSMDHL
jgi:hypothetical protein